MTRGGQVAVWVPDFFLAAADIVSLLVFWLSCQLTAYLCDRCLDGKGTIDPGPISAYAGSMDFWYAALPWYLLWKLEMSSRVNSFIGT